MFYILGIRITSRIKTPHEDITVSEWGLNKTKRDEKVVASLTSFPDRINKVYKTIKTLLNQTVKPDTLVLWLAEEQFPDKKLPENLTKLEKYGLTIKWCEDIKSYKKLVPSLREYPDDIIITFDDDIYYPENTIELLYNSYLNEKNAIHTNRAWRIKLKNDEIIAEKTPDVFFKRYKTSDYKNTIIGCGGTLYPPHSLYKDVLLKDKFMSVIGSQDDMWFWAMAVLNHTPVKVVSSYDLNFPTVEDTQQFGLCKKNSKNKGIGDEGFNIMLKEYPEMKNIINQVCNIL